METQKDSTYVTMDVIHLQEHYNEQIEDTSLSAEQVLSEQKEARGEDGYALLFVP